MSAGIVNVGAVLSSESAPTICVVVEVANVPPAPNNVAKSVFAAGLLNVGTVPAVTLSESVEDKPDGLLTFTDIGL